tara:strand:+ start:386 stop:532 length:147 start_codon:yes stop_codon:yes gene_type:complete
MNKKQREQLKIHSKNHSKKHISIMIKEMTKNKKSFASAHKVAQKEVGK